MFRSRSRNKEHESNKNALPCLSDNLSGFLWRTLSISALFQWTCRFAVFSPYIFLQGGINYIYERETVELRVRSFAMIRKRITDPRSLGSCFIKETEKSSPRVDFSVPLMHRDPSDLGSVILSSDHPKGTRPKTP